MRNLNLAEIRHDYRKAPQFATDNTHEAVIVLTKVSARKWYDGVQYWTEREILEGVRVNSDCSVSTFVERLYE